MSMDSLRQWSNTHYQVEVSLENATHENELFAECMIRKIRGAVLKHCSFFRSKFFPEKVSDILGATVTLDCNTFADLEMNDLALDAFLLLLCKTKGNKKKRQAIIDHVVGRERAKEILRGFSDEL